MTSLMPRLFGDLSGWFDTDFPIRAGHLIPVEDTLSDKEYVLRAELPGLKPDKDLKLTVENGILTVHAEREEQEHVRAAASSATACCSAPSGCRPAPTPSTSPPGTATESWK